MSTPLPLQVNRSRDEIPRSLQHSLTESTDNFPSLNFDVSDPSLDSETFSTARNTNIRAERSVTFASTTEEQSSGQPSLISDIHAARNMSLSQPSSSSSYFRDQTPTRTSSDAAFAPPPFKGLPSDDAQRWLRRFKYYTEYRKMSDDDALQIFKLFMADTAADWLESLKDEDKRSFPELMDRFIERFESSEVFRWQKASEIFSRQQGPTEKVDTFITDILNLAKRVPIEDPTIVRFALLKGLKPSIRQHCLQASADTLDATIKAARIAEAAAAQGPSDTTDIAALSKDVRDLLSIVSDLKKSRSPSVERIAYADAGAAAASLSRSNSPRRVSFADASHRQDGRPTQPSSSYGRRPVNNAPMNWDWPESEQREYSFRRPTPPLEFQRRQSLPTQTWTPTRSRPDGLRWSQNPNRGQFLYPSTNVCRNCGRLHAPDACFARGLQCFNCGRMNHLKVMCRSTPAPRDQPNQNRNRNFQGNFAHQNTQNPRKFRPLH